MLWNRGLEVFRSLVSNIQTLGAQLCLPYFGHLWALSSGCTSVSIWCLQAISFWTCRRHPKVLPQNQLTKNLIIFPKTSGLWINLWVLHVRHWETRRWNHSNFWAHQLRSVGHLIWRVTQRSKWPKPALTVQLRAAKKSPFAVMPNAVTALPAGAGGNHLGF